MYSSLNRTNNQHESYNDIQHSVNNKVKTRCCRLLGDQIRRAAMKITNLNFISLVSDSNQGATCISSCNFSNKVLFQTVLQKNK